MKLVEKYAPRIKYAESYYAKKNAGATLDQDRKFVLAQVLENQSSFLSESFDNTVSTQRSDMGLFKRFTMDIATLVLPNLIAPEVVLVKPMTAMNGYITYFDYVKSSNKGASTQGDLIVNPFKNGLLHLQLVRKLSLMVVMEKSIRASLLLRYSLLRARTMLV